MIVTQPDETRQLEDTRQQLLRAFDLLPAGEVDRCFDEVVARFQGATVRSFVPVVVGKRVRDELHSASG